MRIRLIHVYDATFEQFVRVHDGGGAARRARLCHRLPSLPPTHSTASTPTPTVANPYHYADNDPLNKTDPTGLRPGDGDVTRPRPGPGSGSVLNDRGGDYDVSL